MVNLKVKIGSMELKNPIMPASGTFSEDLHKVFDLNKLGAHVAKTITPEIRTGNPTPRISEVENGILNSMEDLRSIWKETKPFVEGILSSLERDLDEDSELFTYRESGDQSLRGTHERILNFEKLMLL